MDPRLIKTDRRYDSDFLTLRDLVNKNAFGTVTEFENHYDVEMPAWMVKNKTIEYVPGEGMTFGLGAHSIDQALVLFGKPASVTGFLRSVRGVDSEIDDTFTIILQYTGEKKNLLVTIKTAIASPMQDQLKTFIRGTEGSFIKVSLSGIYS
jgi:predicted dehydrogenase